MEKYILDRFEGEAAIIEVSQGNNITYISIGKNKLPPKVKEGDVLIKLKDGKFFVDPKKTENRANTIKEKLDSLWD